MTSGHPFFCRGILELPVYEFAKSDIRNRQTRLRPYDPTTGFTGSAASQALNQLRFSRWNLFHAATKAELMRDVPITELYVNVLCDLLRYRRLFSKQQGNLRLRDGGADAYKDHVRSYLAGKFGEAAAHLFMQDRGYVFWDHIESLATRALQYGKRAQSASVRAKISMHKTGRLKGQHPDFVFEKANRAVAITESKGAFAERGRGSRIKGLLQKGLAQLDNCPVVFTPPAANSYAIATVLRQESDAGKEPSLVAFADPVGDGGRQDKSELPHDWIRRGNYAAWLKGMGFWQQAEALASKQQIADPRERLLHALRLGGHTYAIVIYVIEPSSNYALLSRIPSVPGEELIWPHGVSPCRVFVLGIEETVLRRIEQVLTAPDRTFLEDEGIPEHFETSSPESEIVIGSILRDGTLLGELLYPPRLSAMEKVRFRF